VTKIGDEAEETSGKASDFGWHPRPGPTVIGGLGPPARAQPKPSTSTSASSSSAACPGPGGNKVIVDGQSSENVHRSSSAATQVNGNLSIGVGDPKQNRHRRGGSPTPDTAQFVQAVRTGQPEPAVKLGYSGRCAESRHGASQPRAAIPTRFKRQTATRGSTRNQSAAGAEQIHSRWDVTCP